MSQVKISGNASGTGVFTVASPNSNNTQTLTLPDTTGTLMAQTATGTNLTSGTKYQVGGVATNALAWVNFNGTITSGENRRSSYNVSSVTRNGTGDYTVNFTNAMTDANYTILMTSGFVSTVAPFRANCYTNGTSIVESPPTTTSCRIYLGTTGTPADAPYGYVAIFGN